MAFFGGNWTFGQNRKGESDTKFVGNFDSMRKAKVKSNYFFGAIRELTATNSSPTYGKMKENEHHLLNHQAQGASVCSFRKI